MNAPKETYKILIRESHLDSFGHVNNATYLELFEEARWEIITKNGYGLKEIHATGQAPVILEVNVQFRRELKVREEVTIETEVVSYQGKIGELKQVILNAAGEKCTIAMFKVGIFDLKTRKLIEGPQAWKRALGLEGNDRPGEEPEKRQP